VPSSSIIKPQEGKQISLGYFKTFENKGIEFSVETYYKRMNNLIEYKEGVMSLVSLQSNYDDNFFFGKGESYGIEWLARKNIGKWNGWLGYTLSKSTRSFPDIETGRVYYAKNDRRHDISFVVNYELSSKWTLSGVFVFKSGNAITIPLSRYILQGNIINTYSPKNAYRIPPYHRADLSVTYTYKKTEKREESFNFSVYNVYGRQNPFYIYYETKGDLSKFSIETKAKQVSLFTILPSISWKIAF
jgi:outer membrane usher protein FimD/PapC